MKYSLFIILTITLLIIPLASAKEGHIKLLAVSDDGKNLTGSVADLYLEIQPGKGRTFIETFPLTKTDTQITTRFAKEIACKYANTDCTRYDFFYTIKADTAIIGGPSAGAATTVLTVAMLKGYTLDPGATITGTINSGNIIGAVSGLKQKIQAASEANLTKVLIARGIETIDEKNKTINLTQFGESVNIQVIQVGDIDEALEIFAGIEAEDVVEEITIDPVYSEVMKGLADNLCSKTETLHKAAGSEEDLKELTEESEEFYAKGHYYSAASICFGNNVQLKQEELSKKNISRAMIAKEALQLFDDIIGFEDNLTNISRVTIMDLEAYMIAKERLEDAKRSLSKLPSETRANDAETLAYAYERLQSAISWSGFFGKGGKSYVLDQESLRSSCMEKSSEAQERYEYVNSILPQDLEDIEKDIELAKAYESQGNYELCLFIASKAKARTNTILSSLYTSDDDLNTTIDLKISAAKKVITRQIENGIFPILGYSYYEYAQDLKEIDPHLSFFYTEYAIEMSNLDLYFKQKRNGIRESMIILERLNLAITFLFGAVLGGLFIYFWTHRKIRR